MKEALACNVPFVATDVSDLRKIAQKDPTCQVVDDSADDLARALVDVLESPPPADLPRHLESMTMEAHAQILVASYEVALGNSTSGAVQP